MGCERRCQIFCVNASPAAVDFDRRPVDCPSLRQRPRGSRLLASVVPVFRACSRRSDIGALHLSAIARSIAPRSNPRSRNSTRTPAAPTLLPPPGSAHTRRRHGQPLSLRPAPRPLLVRDPALAERRAQQPQNRRRPPQHRPQRLALSGMLAVDIGDIQPGRADLQASLPAPDRNRAHHYSRELLRRLRMAAPLYCALTRTCGRRRNLDDSITRGAP